MMEEPTMEEAITYVRKLKMKLSQRHNKYDEFLEIMYDFSRRNISPSSLVSKIQDLFNGETHLILGFNRFIPNHCNKLSCQNFQKINTEIPKKIEVGKKISRKDILAVVDFVNRVHRCLEGDNETIKKFYDSMMKYGDNQDLECLKELLNPLFKNHPELEIEFSQICWDVSEVEEEEPTQIDCGETYDKQSRSRNVNIMKKSVMNECEDSMYEADMLMHWLISAKEATERLLEACEENPTEKIEVSSYLTSMNLRSIERLYGEGLGVTMVKLLNQSPGYVSSIILPRLSQKLEEIIAKRIDIYNTVAVKTRCGR